VLYLCPCVQGTPNSRGMLYYLYSLIIYLQSEYSFLGCNMHQCGWIQVSQRNMPTPSSGSKWKGNMWPGLNRHVTLKVLNEIHKRNMKIWAAWFLETTIKTFSYITNCTLLIILPVTQTTVPNDWMIRNKCGWNSLRIV